MPSDPDKQVFLIAADHPQLIATLEKAVRKRVTDPIIYTATDGVQALNKIRNVPPTLCICEISLSKFSDYQLVEEILKVQDYNSMSIVLLGKTPPGKQVPQSIEDQLIHGRIQLLENFTDPMALSKCLTRALNYASNLKPSEFHLRFLSKGDQLIKEGDVPDFVYIVKNGSLRAYRSQDGKDVTLGMIVAGEFVGEMAFVDGGTRTANVEAVDDCELVEVPLNTFEKIIFKKPSWSKRLMATLSRRLRHSNKK